MAKVIGIQDVGREQEDEEDRIPYTPPKVADKPDVISISTIGAKQSDVISLDSILAPSDEIDITANGEGIVGQLSKKGIPIPAELKDLAGVESIINEVEKLDKDDGFLDTLMSAAEFFKKKASKNLITDPLRGVLLASDVLQATSATATGMIGGLAGLAVAAGTLPFDLYKAYREEQHKAGDLSEDNLRIVQGFFTDIPETARAQRYADTFAEYTFGMITELGEALADKFTPEEGALEFVNKHLLETEDFNQKAQAAIYGILRTTPDILLAMLPLAFTRGKVKSTQGEKLPHKDPKTEGYTEARVQVNDLLELKGRIDPRKMTPEDAGTITKELSDVQRGQLDPTIIIRRENGKPVEIIGGRGTLFELEKFRKRGFNLRKVDIRYVDEAPKLTSLEAEAAQRAVDRFDTFNVLDRETALKEARDFADRLIVQETVNPGYVSEKALYGLRTKEGIIAKDLKNLQAGASGHAKIRFLDAHDKIYSGLQSIAWVKKGTLFDKAKSIGKILGPDGEVIAFAHKGKPRKLSPREALDFIISQKRDSMIADVLKVTDPSMKLKGTKQAIVRGAEADSAYKMIAEQLDPRILTDLNTRSSAFFEATLDNAKRLRDEGLITEKEFTALKEIDYVRTDFAKTHIEQSLLEGEVVSEIRPSSADTLKRFGEDSELILTDSMYRTEFRIARNKANVALKRVIAEGGEDASHIGRIAKPLGISEKTGKMKFQKPKKKGTGAFISDEVTIKVWEKGKLSEIIVEKHFAESWNRTGHDNLSFFLNGIRAGTGTQLVKMLATGVNPGFALVSLPMDVMHTYFANSGVFSKQPYVYLGQLGRELVVTGKDAFLRQGRYRKYLEEGGAPDFRTSQGYLPQSFSESQLARKIVNPRVSKLRYYLGYAGETAEVWVRLAIRERVLRNMRKAGIAEDSIHASAVARAMIDYSQSGRVVRVMDSFTPYYSAATQATRTFFAPAFRALEKTGVDGVRAKVPFRKSDAAAWAQAAIGAISTATSWELYNQFYHKEAHRDVNYDDRARYTIIHTGMSFIDEFGTKRHLIGRLKKDPSSVPFNALAVAMVNRILTGKAPPQSWLEYMADGFPVPGKGAFPVLQAFLQYTNDKDFWNNDAIWGGRTGIDPELEVRISTHPLKEFVANLVGASPVRTEKFIDTMLPKNTLMGVGDVGSQFLQKMIDSDQDVNNIWNKAGEELWANFPIARRVLDLTHPIENDLLAEEEQTSQLASQAQGYDNQMSKLLDLRRNGQSVGADIQTLIERASEEHSPQMGKRILSRDIINQILEQTYKTDKTLLHRASVRWWIHTNRMDPGKRAEAFFIKWKREEPPIRRKMENMAAALKKSNYATNEFYFILERLKSERGTDTPVSEFDWNIFSDELTH